MSSFPRRSLFKGGAALAASPLLAGLPVFNRSSFAQSTQPADALEDLRARLKGTLMLPGDSGYDPARQPANGRYRDLLPLAVARCEDEDDAQTCVAWCVENGVRPTVRGGGHSYAGFSTTAELLVDLRRLNHVSINRSDGTATCGGGALNRDFLIAYENSPLFLPGGTCLGVGIGGLTLGGGIGYNAHWAGLTSDHLKSSRMVTATGGLVEFDANQYEDLYWACQGAAGGSFGINTSFTFDLVEASETVTYFRFDWSGSDAAMEAFAAFHTILETAPDALNAVAMAEALPLDGQTPEDAIHTMSRGQYIGPIDELEDLIQPLRAVAGPDSVVVEEKSFWAMQRQIASEEPVQHCFGDISRYANESVPDDVIAEMVEVLIESPVRTDDANCSIWSLGWVGGVVGNKGRTDTAYVHRDALTLLRPTTVWPNDTEKAVEDEINAWTAQVVSVIEPHTPNESYQNFPNRAIEDYAEQYYAENLPRLVEIKQRWDPDNLFQNPQSVPVEL